MLVKPRCSGSNRSPMLLGVVAALAGCVAVASAPNPVDACLGNLRKIGVGLLVYAEANDGWIPPYRTNDETTFITKRKAKAEPLKWKESLKSVGGVAEAAFWCDEAKRLGPKKSLFGDDYAHTSYSTMGFLGAVGRGDKAISELISPQGFVTLNLASVVNPRDGYACDIAYSEAPQDPNVFNTAHGKGYSMVMFDGSVAYVPLDFDSDVRKEWRKPPKPKDGSTP
ncbi:MAG: hypothetical protein KIS66_11600 [Fimbriimonadaceae bacterium]|nr:hypothetical protein [Fimbriimonadaceae bacterium]